nr:type II secretion system F family protein [Rhodococcus sp. X156]
MLVAVLLGLAAVLGIGGAAGATCGVLLATGGYVGMRRVSRGPATPPDRLGAAGAYDLLAACLHSGLPVATAVLVVAPSAPPAMAAALRQAGELLRLGADPAAAWAAAAEQEDTEPLARLARRSGRSGASLAGGVAELAELQRAAAEDSAAAGAERAGVLVAGPLGLCFLPAFVCLGVAPVVVGLAGPLLQGGLV